VKKPSSTHKNYDRADFFRDNAGTPRLSLYFSSCERTHALCRTCKAFDDDVYKICLIFIRVVDHGNLLIRRGDYVADSRAHISEYQRQYAYRNYTSLTESLTCLIENKTRPLGTSAEKSGRRSRVLFESMNLVFIIIV